MAGFISPNSIRNILLSTQGTPQYTGISQHTSTQSVAIQILWGTRRVSPNIIWQGVNPFVLAGGSPLGSFLNDAFICIPPVDGGNGFTPIFSGTPSTGTAVNIIPGGWLGAVFIKGTGFANVQYGVPDTSNSDSRWWVPANLALGEGPINSINRMWNGGGSAPMTVNWTGGVAPSGPTYQNAIDPPSLFYTLFTGTTSQTAWGYIAWVNAYPGAPYYPNSQAMSYRNTAYIASALFDYGHGNTPPQQSFEVQRTPNSAFQATDSYSIGVDYSLADIIPDLLTSVQYGAGLSSGDIDSASLLLFKQYQFAQGLYFSPLLDSQTKIVDILNRWAMVSNTWIYWSGTSIMFAPLGDETITANGQTFTPAQLSAYAVSTGNFIGKPLEVHRADPIDCHNRVFLEISDRFNDYAKNTLEWKDSTLIGLFGLRDANSVDGQDICDVAVGAKSLELIGKRTAYIRNHYTFTLPHLYIRVLPGTLLTVKDDNTGLIVQVRIVSVDEDANGDLNIVAEEFSGFLGISRARPTQAWGGNGSTPGGSSPTGTGGGMPAPAVVVTSPGSPAVGPGSTWVEFTNGAGTLLLPAKIIPGAVITFTHISNGVGNGGLLEVLGGTPVTLDGNGHNVIDPQDKLLPAAATVKLHTSGMNFQMSWDGSVWRCVGFS